jgi:hypothetical protein
MSQTTGAATLPSSPRPTDRSRLGAPPRTTRSNVGIRPKLDLDSGGVHQHEPSRFRQGEYGGGAGECDGGEGEEGFGGGGEGAFLLLPLLLIAQTGLTSLRCPA